MPRKRLVGALGIVDANRNAVVIAEIKFRKIAMQMLFLAMLVHAVHAALEDREHVFDGVGVDDYRPLANVLASSVLARCRCDAAWSATSL